MKSIAKARKNILTSLELFTGAGGLALGLHQAGFTHKALVEWNPHAIKTLRLNCSSLLGISQSSIYHMDAKEFNYDCYEGIVDLMAGGPPCQPFSTGGKSLAYLDPRDMFPTFLNAMRVIRPKAVLIENVKGLLRERFSDYFHYIIKRIEYPFCVDDSLTIQKGNTLLDKASPRDFNLDEQYNVAFFLIDTADYGVPQRRERVLIVAFRKDLDIIPNPVEKTHSKESLLFSQYISKEYWNRYGLRENFFLGQQARNLISQIKNDPDKFRNALKLKPWRTVRDGIFDLPPPVARGETEKKSNHVQHPGARIYQGHSGSFHDYPAKALKAGTHGTPGGENILRINNTDKVRYFTTREAARLHTFPDEWRFNGETWGSCITQLGNAVPVDIGRIWGAYIKSQLSESKR